MSPGGANEGRTATDQVPGDDSSSARRHGGKVLVVRAEFFGSVMAHDDATNQISLASAEHRPAVRRASELDISLAEYIRRLVRRDIWGPSVQETRAACLRRATRASRAPAG